VQKYLLLILKTLKTATEFLTAYHFHHTSWGCLTCIRKQRGEIHRTSFSILIPANSFPNVYFGQLPHPELPLWVRSPVVSGDSRKAPFLLQHLSTAIQIFSSVASRLLQSQNRCHFSVYFSIDFNPWASSITKWIILTCEFVSNVNFKISLRTLTLIFFLFFVLFAHFLVT
jgi:hypothetical protein